MWQTLAFISALFSALAAGFEKKALEKSHPINFSFLLSILTLVISLPFLFFTDLSNIQPITLLVLYGKSILGALSFLWVMYGLKKLEISTALPLLVLTPGVVAICAFFLFNEPLGSFEILGMILLLSGTYFLQIKPGQNLLSPFKLKQTPKAFNFIIGAIVLFSATTLLDKTILKTFKLSPEAFIPIQQIFFSFNFGVIYLLMRKSSGNLKSDLKSQWKLIALIAFFALVYRYTQIAALKYGSAALVLAVKRTSVFFTTVIGGRYFKDQNLLIKTMATIVMIVGAIFIILA